MVPAETGRFWYQRLKRAYRAFRLAGVRGADMVMGTKSDLAYRLIARLSPEVSGSTPVSVEEKSV
jgi:hypothetical protein